jgi:hypothetical protein
MNGPSESAVHSGQGTAWGAMEAHHRPVTSICRPACEVWVRSLLGAILVARIGLLGRTG